VIYLYLERARQIFSPRTAIAVGAPSLHEPHVTQPGE
jgi:hypothetical protein